MFSNNFEGINDNNKPSSKVLRPPGGGSSDIFGVSMPQTPRSVKNHMQSNIFSCEKNIVAKNNGEQTRRGQKNIDSYSRLFGEPDRPMTPARNNMKSNIPFGAGTEAAKKLLANGNSTRNIIGKSGSVSSTSSSVSSSTENLKINGGSKTEMDAACPKTPTPTSSRSVSARSTKLNMDLPCEEKTIKPRSELSDKAQPGSGDVSSQTRRNTGCNVENPNSYSKMVAPYRTNEPPTICLELFPKTKSLRNPITGLGLGEDGVGGIKPKKPKDRRDGNPVTGEGYKPGSDTTNTASVNGANQVINKNRIPPGGYSSGLW